MLVSPSPLINVVVTPQIKCYIGRCAIKTRIQQRNKSTTCSKSTGTFESKFQTVIETIYNTSNW